MRFQTTKYPNDNVLYHHGIKGMKWGVRRTPEQLGHRKKTNAQVNSIVKKMINIDRERLGVYDAEYSSKTLVKRFLKTVGNTPVAFFDISDEEGIMNVSLGTDPNYRGRGYASQVAKSGLQWWDKNREKYGDKKLSYWVRDDNVGSIKVAEKAGFTKNEKESKRFKGWSRYEY